MTAVLSDIKKKIMARSYMSERLMGLHNAGAEVNFREKFLVFLASLAVIFLLPFFHLGK